MTTGNGLTQGQAQPQTLWGRRHPQLLQIAVEEVRLLLRGDAHAAVCHCQQHLSRCGPQRHRDLAAGGRVLYRIGQQIPQQPLQIAGVDGRYMGRQAAPQGQPHPGMGHQRLGAVHQLRQPRHQLHILRLQRLCLRDQGGGGEIVHQPQQPVVALAQDGGALPGGAFALRHLLRHQPGQRRMDVAHGPPQLRCDLRHDLLQ